MQIPTVAEIFFSYFISLFWQTAFDMSTHRTAGAVHLRNAGEINFSSLWFPLALRRGSCWFIREPAEGTQKL